MQIITFFFFNELNKGDCKVPELKELFMICGLILNDLLVNNISRTKPDYSSFFIFNEIFLVFIFIYFFIFYSYCSFKSQRIILFYDFTTLKKKKIFLTYTERQKNKFECDNSNKTLTVYWVITEANSDAFIGGPSKNKQPKSERDRKVQREVDERKTEAVH